ncbi:hypothetical protein SAMN04515695_5426 [Pseudovibrio sp. Tun.PSC04-5.I4]|nr:hypothetical protein SAMN04515695_3079 [Pseudovibrio sp. Tun.PSC04-5.I4]SDR40404.1 hypothetical protein SAMN04515695_5426 [Pseudovibrio sp. Tun.PSC04-5.I4]
MILAATGNSEKIVGIGMINRNNKLMPFGLSDTCEQSPAHEVLNHDLPSNPDGRGVEHKLIQCIPLRFFDAVVFENLLHCFFLPGFKVWHLSLNVRGNQQSSKNEHKTHKHNLLNRACNNWSLLSQVATIFAMGFVMVGGCAYG